MRRLLIILALISIAVYGHGQTCSLTSSDPQCRFYDTTKTPTTGGLNRIKVNNGDLTLEQNTAAAANFSTATKMGSLGPVSVKAFDAKGDGVTDDSAAFQDAIDSLVATGGTIYIPKGRYIVHDVEVSSYYPINLIGDMYGYSLNSVANTGSYIAPGQACDYIFKFISPGVRGSGGRGTVKGLFFADPSSEDIEVPGYAIAHGALYLYDFGTSLVEDCSFYSLGGSAIKTERSIMSTIRHVVIRHCGTNSAIDLAGLDEYNGTQSFTISDSRLEVNYDDYYISLNQYCYNVHIENVKFEYDSTLTDSSQIFIYDNGTHTTIANCHFNRNGTTKLQLAGSAAVVTGINAQYGKPSTEDKNPVIIVSGSRNTITGGYIQDDGNTATMILVSGGQNTLTGLICYNGGNIVSTGSHNKFVGLDISLLDTTQAYALELTTYNKAIGVSISGLTGTSGGVHLQGTGPSLIGSTIINTAAIGIYNESANSFIEGNLSSNNVTDYSSTSDANYVWNNRFTNSDIDIRLRGDVGIGIDDPITDLHMVGTGIINGAARILSLIYDSTAMAAGVGATLGLGGKHTAAGAYSVFGAISGEKENATEGNVAGYLSFLTRPAGGDLVEHFRINSSGHLKAITDNTVDIGAAGDNRPRNIYAGTSVVAPEINSTGIAIGDLGSSANGTILYCTDCTANSNPCSGSGTGAIAKRLNGAWDCR